MSVARRRGVHGCWNHSPGTWLWRPEARHCCEPQWAENRLPGFGCCFICCLSGRNLQPRRWWTDEHSMQCPRVCQTVFWCSVFGDFSQCDGTPVFTCISIAVGWFKVQFVTDTIFEFNSILPQLSSSLVVPVIVMAFKNLTVNATECILHDDTLLLLNTSASSLFLPSGMLNPTIAYYTVVTYSHDLNHSCTVQSFDMAKRYWSGIIWIALLIVHLFQIQTTIIDFVWSN